MCNIGFENKNPYNVPKIYSNNTPEKADLKNNPDDYSESGPHIIKDGLEVRRQNPGIVPVSINIPYISGESGGTKFYNENYSETPSIPIKTELKAINNSKQLPNPGGEAGNFPVTEEDEDPPEVNQNYDKFIPYIAGEGSSKPH